jgi:hypothetical protein
MVRTRAFLVLLLVGCGGRDPLVGVEDDGTNPPVVTTDGGSKPGTPPGLDAGSPGSTPPASKPDASVTMPPDMPPPTMPPPTVPPPGSPRDAGVTVRDAAPGGRPDAARSCTFPDCIAKLMFQCQAEGACVQQRMGGNNGGTNICYANGVRVTSMPSGGRGQSANVRVLGADGKLCYTYEAPPGRGGGGAPATYRDSLGNVMATATTDNGFMAITCTGQMIPTVVSSACQPGATNGMNGCTNGMCN